jgi:hypothetical protein
MLADRLFSSASGVHNTPADIMERARAALEGIELDPASSAEANRTVRAARFYSDQYSPDRATDEADPTFAGFDGLAPVAERWRSQTLWLNPPFSTEKRRADGTIELNSKNQPIRQRVIGLWVQRWRATINHKLVSAAMLLVPARTDTEWFRPLFGLAMCFVAGRLTFSDAANSAPFPTAIIYAGPNEERFYTLFEEVGECGKFVR